MAPLLPFAWRRFRGGPPAPADPFYAVGDVHGRADLLEALLDRLLRSPVRGPLVLLGDMIDRGPDSARVLRLMHGLSDLRVVCLCGNHEEMMLDFLEGPAWRCGHWLRHGGLATLDSFGIAPPDPALPETHERCTTELRQALGPVLPWLRALPTLWRSGNVVAAHAGLDPARPPKDQTRTDLLWGYPYHARRPRRDGLWVVHGHVVQSDPVAHRGRVAIDTGAWFTDRLTAARIEPGRIEFITEDRG